MTLSVLHDVHGQRECRELLLASNRLEVESLSIPPSSTFQSLIFMDVQSLPWISKTIHYFLERHFPLHYNLLRQSKHQAHSKHGVFISALISYRVVFLAITLTQQTEPHAHLKWFQGAKFPNLAFLLHHSALDSLQHFWALRSDCVPSSHPFHRANTI